jgi:hypothetical protein
VALLDSTSRARVGAQYMRENAELSPWSKADLAAAVAAADQWAEDNAASYNSALPAAFRTTASATQKAALLGYVIWRRIGRLHTDEDG